MRDLVCWAAAHIKDREDEVAQWKGYDAPSSLSSWGALKAGTSRFPPKSITLEKIPSSHSDCLCNHGHFKARNKDSRAQRGFCPWRSGHYSTLMPEIPLLHVDGNLSKLQENTETLSAISIQHRRRQHFGFCLPAQRTNSLTLSRRQKHLTSLRVLLRFDCLQFAAVLRKQRRGLPEREFSAGNCTC